jgi:hypothetical protein
MADPTRLLNLEVRRTGGEVEGPMDAWLVRERIYAGRYTGREDVRALGAEWRPISLWDEFAPVLVLSGVDVEGMRITANQKRGMTGWKANDGAVAPPPRTEAAEPRSQAPEAPAAPAAEPKPSAPDKPGLPLPWVIGGAVALAACAAGYFLLT